MSDELTGNDIIELLDSLASKPLSKNVQSLYEDAYKSQSENQKPEDAITLCKKVLAVLERSPRVALGDLESRVYAKGKCHILLASINLNEGKLKEAKEHYLHSKDKFHSMQWSHLESLAYLGLAITWRKLKNYSEASDACEKAQYFLDHESVSIKINKIDLHKAIEKERAEIQKSLLSPIPQPNKPNEKMLPIFSISAGEKFVAKGGTTDLNLFSRKDYEQHIGVEPPLGILDLTVWPQARTADYILEIDENVDGVDNDIEKGIWLLIRGENSSDRLKGKTVAVLIIYGSKIFASQKVFSKAADHYFLKAKSRDAPSFIVVHYKTNFYDRSKIKNYYQRFGKVVQKWVYDVRISGEVIESIKVTDSTIGLKRTFIWRVPMVSTIAAGLGRPIEKDYIESYIYLEENEHRDADYFITTADGNSMSGDNILSGDKVLIRQQPVVKIDDIAAIVIKSPDISNSLGVLKRYYVDEHKDRQHWFLKSSNPSARHLVVVPSHTSVERIRKIYARPIAKNKVQIYKNAELTIVGKYMRVIR